MNVKSEYRISKSETISNVQNSNVSNKASLGHWNIGKLGFVSNFVLRISKLTPCILILFTLLLAAIGAAQAATITAASCSQADVQAAVNAASDGDTVRVPAGSCTWPQAVQITKPLTIMGAGSGIEGTKLTASGLMPNGFFNITGFNASSLVRVTGFTFQMTNWTPYTAIHVHDMAGGVNGGQIRIDNNVFNFGNKPITFDYMKGLIDHNYFYNGIQGISFSSGSRANADAAWASLTAGSADALFIENNHFITDANYTLNYTQEQIGTYNGGKLVVRYNDFKANDVPDTLQTYTPFMAHGSADGGCGGVGYWEYSPCQRRGQSIIEFYNNTESGKRIDFMFTSRGSSNLVYNNAISGTVKYNPRIILVEEEYTSDNWSVHRTAWPAEDQIHNTFIWNNTYRGHDFNDGTYGSIETVPTNYSCTANGTPMSCCTGIKTGTCGNNSTPTSNPFIRKDRDYFLHAPCGASDTTDAYGNACTYGRETFTGLNGASNTYPTDGIKYPTLGTMVSSSSGPNAYYPYTPYTYPHPLAKPDTHTTASCSQADVQAALDAASPGDTVMAPAGSCSWNTRLVITKGITLQGAGIGQTVITAGTDPQMDYSLINYIPSAPSLNEPFRITGFTLDCNFKAHGITLQNYTTSKINKVRIDHNRILNPKTKYTGRSMYVQGAVYGVVDNNIFENAQISSLGFNEKSWENFSRDFGNGDNMYYEDNTYSGSGCFHDAGHGGRYVLRYNDFTGLANMFPIFDMHGNQLGNLAATMVSEFYGNKLEFGNYGGLFLDQRGGQAMVFNNRLTGTQGAWARIREEYDDALNGGYPQHVMNSYYWNNRAGANEFVPYNDIVTGSVSAAGSNYIEDAGKNFDLSRDRFCTPGSSCQQYGVKITSGTGAGQFRQVVSLAATRITVLSDWDVIPDSTSQYRVKYDCCDAIEENREFFAHNVAFNGTAGVGCGSLSARPATCTPGVGYWATEQSCSNVDDANIGAHPEIPISGALYKCTAPNTWTEYYTPYTYPHPLRQMDMLWDDVSGDGNITAYDAGLALQLGRGELEAGQIAQTSTLQIPSAAPH